MPYSIKIHQPKRIKESYEIKREHLLRCPTPEMKRREIERIREVVVHRLVSQMIQEGMIMIDEIPSEGGLCIFADAFASPLQKINVPEGPTRKGPTTNG